MTIAVDLGRKARNQTKQKRKQKKLHIYMYHARADFKRVLVLNVLLSTSIVCVWLYAGLAPDAYP